MNTTNVVLDQEINVINKYNKQLAKCTFKRALKLVKRKRAIWVNGTTIKLIIDKNDRKKIKEQVINRDKRICYICGEFIPEDTPATIDHVIPKSEGGEDSLKNLKCCCKRCNDDKAYRDIQKYIKHIMLNREIYTWISEEQLQYLKKTYLK